MADAMFRVTWKRSAVDKPRDQQETVRALGLRRLNQTVEVPDTPAYRGMIHKVRHLLEVALAKGEGGE